MISRQTLPDVTLQQLAELGYVTGLQTLGEAACYAELHWDAWPQPSAFEELNREVDQAAEYGIGFDMLCVHFIGEGRCREIDVDLETAMSAVSSDAPGFEEVDL